MSDDLSGPNSDQISGRNFVRKMFEELKGKAEHEAFRVMCIDRAILSLRRNVLPEVDGISA